MDWGLAKVLDAQRSRGHDHISRRARDPRGVPAGLAVGAT